jgi:hypothetical protein
MVYIVGVRTVQYRLPTSVRLSPTPPSFQKEYRMKSKTKNKMSEFRSLEQWNTRFGKSKRVVTRDAKGRFVDNVSLKAISLR